MDAGKEQKGSAEAFSERAHIQREVQRALVCALHLPPSLFPSLSLSVSLCRSVGARGSIRGRKEEVRTKSEENTRRTREQKRGTDRSVRERNPRLPWLPSHSRLASLPWRRLAALSLSLSLSPLSPALCPSPSSTRSLPVPFPPPLPLTHPSSHPPASLTPRFSPSSRQLRQASLYLSGSFAHILSSCSLGRRGREGRRDKERNARVREKREGKERMRDTLPDVFHDADVSRFSNRSISYRLKVIYVRPPSPSLSPSPYRGPSLAAA